MFEFRVARRADLAARGIDRNRVRRRVASQRWQEPVPGVVVGHSGALTLRERREVAIAWGGESARLSHTSALHVHRAHVELPRSAVRVAGVRGDYSTPEDGGLEQITVSHGRHLSSRAFVVVHQSRRPTGELVVAGLPVTSAARAVVDVAVTARTRRDVEHVVADASGTYLVDGLWRRQNLVGEADGAAFHLGSAEWQADLVRQNAIVGTGKRLLRFPVPRLRREPAACGRELRRALGL